MNRFLLLPVATLTLLAGCAGVGDDHDHDHDHEVITTVVLTFTAQDSGDVVEATWADPEDDGDPVVDSIELLDSEDYDLDVSFLNELEEPAEDLTAEVSAEGTEHQLFFIGSAVAGPAGSGANAVVTHAYDDVDEEGNPVGLASTITTDATGSGVMRVVLRHLPFEDGSSIKTSTLAADVAADGIDSLPGDSDVDVDFDLEVL